MPGEAAEACDEVPVSHEELKDGEATVHHIHDKAATPPATQHLGCSRTRVEIAELPSHTHPRSPGVVRREYLQRL